MILGIGTDIVDANRIDKIYNKFNYKFVERLYGSNEINILNNRKKISINFLAKRFAAKEATWKALSFSRGDGLFFKEMEILNDKNGQPYLFFSGKTRDYVCQRERSLGGNLNFSISMSDEPPYALAFVVISLAPFKKVLHKI